MILLLKLKFYSKAKKVLKNKPITVKFLGKYYKYITNKKGIVYFKISKNTINSLKSDETYGLYVYYYNDAIKRTVQVRNNAKSNFNVYFIL